eukprot:518214-Rhodomonas_salina.3
MSVSKTCVVRMPSVSTDPGRSSAFVTRVSQRIRAASAAMWTSARGPTTSVAISCWAVSTRWVRFGAQGVFSETSRWPLECARAVACSCRGCYFW